MLPIKHLIYNPQLSKTLIKHWRSNPLKKEAFEAFRVSSNIMTWHSYDNRWYFLRMTPSEETSTRKIQSELAFLKYLEASGYPAVCPVSTMGDELFVQEDTIWGSYTAASFYGVKGHQLSEEKPSEALAALWGTTLGKLHVQSQGYQAEGPEETPFSWFDRLEWCERILLGASPERVPEAVKEELMVIIQAIKCQLEALPSTQDHLGLIHYDFEPDNLIYDQETKRLTPIDFDDCHVHWYLQDVERALNALAEDWTEHGPETESLEQAFLDAYAEARGLDGLDLKCQLASQRSLFSRYASLLGYARLVHALSMQPSESEAEHEKDWLPGLINRLEQIMSRRLELVLLKRQG